MIYSDATAGILNVMGFVPKQLQFEVLSGQIPVSPYYESALEYGMNFGYLRAKQYPYERYHLHQAYTGNFTTPTIYFPAGTFVFDRTLNIPRAKILGAGKHFTIFHFPAKEVVAQTNYSEMKHNLTPQGQYVLINFESQFQYRDILIKPKASGIQDVTIALLTKGENTTGKKYLPICIEDQTTELTIRGCNIQVIPRGYADSLISINYGEFIRFQESRAEYVNRYSHAWYESKNRDVTSNWQIDPIIEGNLFEGGEVAQVIMSGHNIRFQNNQQYYTSCPFMFMNVIQSHISGNSIYPYLPDSGEHVLGVKEQMGGFLWGSNNIICNNYKGLSHPHMIIDEQNLPGSNDNLTGKSVTSSNWPLTYTDKNNQPAFIKAWPSRFRFK